MQLHKPPAAVCEGLNCMKKSSLALLALALALLTALPALAAGDAPVTLTAETSGEAELSPEYECVCQAELFQFGSLTGAHTAGDSMECLSSESSLAQVIADAIGKKQTRIDISSFRLTATITVVSDKTTFTGPDVELIRSAYAMACNDHPEYIYAPNGYSLSGASSGSSTVQITALNVTYDPFYTDEVLARFESAVTDALSRVSGVSDPVEQALILHDYLVSHVTYNWDVATTGKITNSRVYSAYGALVEGDAVCQGYALAYRLLLTELGINCTTISSDVMKHMWNAVELDGTWYHVDVTWDDPTPNVQGGGQHAYFLRGNTWMQSTSETETESAGNHPTWDDGQTACSDTDYQSDWWLNSGWFPTYRWNGSYYYIKMGETSYAYTIYQTTSLLEAGSRVTSGDLDNSYSSQNGVVWVDGQLYYTKSGGTGYRTLTRVDLATGQSVKVGDISFTKTASADEHYSSERDGVGLWYDPEQDLILATSNTRPGLSLGSFPVRSYPAEWDDLPTSTAAVRARWLGTSLQVGAVLPDSSTDVSLWAAFYDRDTGRLTALRQLDVGGAVNGLNVWELDDCGQLANCDTSLFLLDGGVLKPLCPSAAAQ